jgi:hypothetical protein
MALKAFADLDEREGLTRAANAEEADSPVYQSFTDSLRQSDPHSAQIFDAMADDSAVCRCCSPAFSSAAPGRATSA